MKKKLLRRLHLNRETLHPLTELPQVVGQGSGAAQCCSNPITLTRPTLGLCGATVTVGHEDRQK
jgi:hypothetical protein